MPRPTKGQRTPGAGRKKGTPNKKTVELMQVLEKHNFDPGEELIYCYRQAKQIFEFRKKRSNLAGALTALDRMSEIAEDIAQFIYPKKKAIEHSGEVGVRTFADFIASAEGDEDEGEE
jgi:hypothetical protein